MANVLNEEKKQQVLALGRLGWSLRRIQQATRIRRETASAYLKAAGIAVRPPSGWGRHAPKPANEVITDSGAAKPITAVIPDPLDPNVNCNPNPENLSTKGKAKATSKPANEVITDSEVVTGPSACEPYREAIDLGLSRGRNAMAIWQDLVSEFGFASSYQSVQRFVRKRRGTQTPEARVVIVTASGQEAQVDYGTGPMVRDPESRKYRRTRLFVMTLGCSRKSVRLLTFPLQFAHLGRVARAGLSPTGRLHPHRRARQSARGRACSRHLRSRSQSSLSRCPRPLRRGGHALPHSRSRPQR
jgi:hypothetical protein